MSSNAPFNPLFQPHYKPPIEASDIFEGRDPFRNPKPYTQVPMPKLKPGVVPYGQSHKNDNPLAVADVKPLQHH